jgi:hypothetical protein
MGYCTIAVVLAALHTPEVPVEYEWDPTGADGMNHAFAVFNGVAIMLFASGKGPLR